MSLSKYITEEIDTKINRTRTKVINQCENLHSQRFSKLCPNGIVHVDKSKKKKSRKFIPKSKYRRLQKKKIQKPLRGLVTNYSDFPIVGTPCESVLNLGLNYVPSRSAPNTTQILANLQHFNRRVRWAEYWAGRDKPEENVSKPIQLFKQVKTNYPKVQPSTYVRNFLENIKDDILYSSLNKVHKNLSQEQEKAIVILKQEQKNRNICIKPNDKNGGCSVMNTSDYIKQCEAMLYATYKDAAGEEQTYYRTNVPKEVLTHHWSNIKDAVEEGRRAGYVSDGDAALMVTNEPKPGRFYGLVKNHIDKESWPAGSNIPPLRPVVSGSGSNTENISLFVDEFAKKEVPKLESYIEDSRDLLQLIEEVNELGPQPHGAIPVTMDISGMYTNIPWDQGILAFQEAMDARDDTTVPTAFLITLLMLVLSCNVFTFNGTLFLQLFGVAMGTRVAPTFACLFMGWLEKKMLLSWKGKKPILWRRYIDDIIFLWHGSKHELCDFIKHMNSLHPTIKFKCNEGEHYDFTSQSVNFLDMKIFIDETGYIQTTLYTKPGKLCQYLLPSSHHPSHITRNIPYSLAYRLLRLESIQTNFLINLEKLRSDLLSRQYSPSSIDSAFSKVLALNRKDCLKKVQRKSNNRIPLVLPYHRSLPKVSSSLLKHWRILKDKDPDALTYMPEPPMVCYTRDKNLRDILVRAVLPPPARRRGLREPKKGFSKCGKRTDCSVCSHSNSSSTRTVYRTDGTKEVLPIQSKITCTDESVIYVISCEKGNGDCGRFHPQYVGETGHSAKWRCSRHLGTITNPSQVDTTTPVGSHFRLQGHNHSHMNFLPIEKIESKDPFVRKVRESFYIHQYHTLKTKDISSIEHGLNLQT